MSIITNSTEEELRETAAQLAKPQGENGLKMAEVMNEVNRSMIGTTIENLDVHDGDVVLELGPGNGDHVKYLMERADLEYHGLEISDTMLGEAERRSASIGKGKVSFCLYDGTELPFPSDHFDRIFTVNTIYFWQQPVKLLSEIRRVLKPDAKALITFGQKSSMEKLPFVKWNFKLYDNAAITELALMAGFGAPEITAHRDTFEAKEGEKFEREFGIAVLKKEDPSYRNAG